MSDKAVLDQTITIEDFADLMADDLAEAELAPDTLEKLLAVLAEIKPHAPSFQANTPELVQLAAQHSATFQALPADRQRFFTSVLSMPVFFFTLPLGEEEADRWMKENRQHEL